MLSVLLTTDNITKYDEDFYVEGRVLIIYEKNNKTEQIKDSIINEIKKYIRKVEIDEITEIENDSDIVIRGLVRPLFDDSTAVFKEKLVVAPVNGGEIAIVIVKLTVPMETWYDLPVPIMRKLDKIVRR